MAAVVDEAIIAKPVVEPPEQNQIVLEPEVRTPPAPASAAAMAAAASMPAAVEAAVSTATAEAAWPTATAEPPPALDAAWPTAAEAARAGAVAIRRARRRPTSVA